MITKLASMFVERLIHSGLVSEDDRDLFGYGFWIVLSNVVCFFEVFIFGSILGVLWESILFYFAFISLRGYAGGAHARKEITCIFCTTLAMLCSMVAIRLMETRGGHIIQFACLILGSMAIFLLSPLDSPEKPLDGTELQHFRNISLIFTGTIDIAAVIAHCAGINGFVETIAVSIILEGILLVIGKIKQLSA